MSILRHCQNCFRAVRPIKILSLTVVQFHGEGQSGLHQFDRFLIDLAYLGEQLKHLVPPNVPPSSILALHPRHVLSRLGAGIDDRIVAGAS